MIRNLFFVLLGMIGGLWLVWPGVIKQESWDCAKEVVLKSQREQVDIRVVLASSPRDLINREKLGNRDKLRIIGDACFRK